MLAWVEIKGILFLKFAQWLIRWDTVRDIKIADDECKVCVDGGVSYSLAIDSEFSVTEARQFFGSSK